MHSYGLSKCDALAAMWYSSNKDNDQLTELSVVVVRMIQVQLILAEIKDISGPRLPLDGIFRRSIVCCDHRGPELFELQKNHDARAL